MEFLTNALAFVAVLGVMIFFHEFGHFITAKAFGMRVFIFSFGFGTRLFGFKWGETDCRVSAIPLGGYVKLEGEPDDKLSEDTALLGDGKDFGARPRWQRFLVYLAGPFMNFVLTIGVMAGLFMVGIEVDASMQERPIVGFVDPGSPAANAGLQPGDEVLEIDGKPVTKWEETQIGILIRPDQATRMRIARGGQQQDVTVQVGSTSDKVGSIGIHPLVRIGIGAELKDRPAARAGLQTGDAIVAVDGKPLKSFADIIPLVTAANDRPLRLLILRDGRQQEIPVTPVNEGAGPKIGVGPYLAKKQFGFAEATRESVKWTWAQVRLTGEVLKRLLTAQLSPKTMMGPLGIAKASGDAARQGGLSIAMLIAIISLQIGIMNLLPMPPLDGGHLAIIASEGLLRRDFSENVKVAIMNAGAVALFLLIGLVLYSDLSKTSLLGKYLP